MSHFCFLPLRDNTLVPFPYKKKSLNTLQHNHHIPQIYFVLPSNYQTPVGLTPAGLKLLHDLPSLPWTFFDSLMPLSKNLGLNVFSWHTPFKFLFFLSRKKPEILKDNLQSLTFPVSCLPPWFQLFCLIYKCVWVRDVSSVTGRIDPARSHPWFQMAKAQPGTPSGCDVSQSIPQV